MKSYRILTTMLLLFVFAFYPGDQREPILSDKQQFKPSLGIFSQDMRERIQNILKNADRSEFRYIPKKPGHYTAEDWRAVIDSTWGEGLPTEEKLKLFDDCWKEIDETYPSFHNIDVNWDSLRNVYRPEVAAGVSRGRFYAIMCHMFAQLWDKHSHVQDIPVAFDSLKWGMPLFVNNGYQSVDKKLWFNQDYCHFGASLSPLPDKSLLVYDVIENHPLGLERGDIIIGYDGIPWHQLVQELFKAELPFASFAYHGSNKPSFDHMFLNSAGENWHLFDTIDIVKYNNGDTLHLPTSLLINKKMKLLTTSQLPIPGVPLPNHEEGHYVTYGVVEGTNIGYMYAWNWWNWSVPLEPFTHTWIDFVEGLTRLIFDHHVEGLIIDSRYNRGGDPLNYIKGLRIIFNQNQDVFEWFARANPDDHYAMKSWNVSWAIVNFATDNYLFDRPIAILTGPASASCGDFMPMQMRFHPMSRQFGLPTNGAFGGIEGYSDGDWDIFFTQSNAKMVTEPDYYMTHRIYPPDEELWFTQEDVVKGEDTVVKRALKWINNLSHAHDVTVNKGYIIPGVDSVVISAVVENPNDHDLQVTSYVTTEGDSLLDSLQLSPESGNNGNIWQGIFYADSKIERAYFIDIKTEDRQDSIVRILPDVHWFTSIGPISIDHVEFVTNDTIANPGDLLAMRVFLRNHSSTTSVNISATMTCADTFASIRKNNTLSDFGVIGPGEVVQSEKYYIVQIADGPFPESPHELQLILDIHVHEKIELRGDTINKYFSYWQDSLSIAVGIDNEEALKPTCFALYQNYPNPFNPTTTITYRIPKTSQVDLNIYNTLGQKVTTLVSKKQTTGNYEIEWNSTGFASGVYYYRLVAGEYREVRKMLLVR